MAAEIPLRPLGRTGLKVSALGLGGHHLGDVPTIDEGSNSYTKRSTPALLFSTTARHPHRVAANLVGH